jgi:hypothetical protein
MVFAFVCLPVSRCRAVSHELSGWGPDSHFDADRQVHLCGERKSKCLHARGTRNEAAKLPRRRAELLRGLSQLSSRALDVQLAGY